MSDAERGANVYDCAVRDYSYTDCVSKSVTNALHSDLYNITFI